MNRWLSLNQQSKYNFLRFLVRKPDFLQCLNQAALLNMGSLWSLPPWLTSQFPAVDFRETHSGQKKTWLPYVNVTCPDDTSLLHFVKPELYFSIANQYITDYIFAIVLLSFLQIWLFKLLPIPGYVFMVWECVYVWVCVCVHVHYVKDCT